MNARPDPSPGPSATFIVFAYNQERFIAEAVESVFAQTYGPLEIILSDDGSSDSTFEIMREMAKAYRGPHQVRAVQTERNLGVTRHVLLRCREARGDIIVVAAGDDVSQPERTETLVRAFGDDPATMAVCSGFDLIDADGALISSGNLTPIGVAGAKRVMTYFRGLEWPYETIQGSTASYRREAFALPTPPGELLLSEDNLLNFLIYADGGRVRVIPEALLLYRQHGAALSNRGDEALPLEERERRQQAMARTRANKMETFLWIGEHCRRPELVDTALLRRELRIARVMSGWADAGLPRRLALLAGALLNGRRTLSKWQAARLFGRFPNYLPLRWMEPDRRAKPA